ncbi:MAG: ABC transporter substrate-binding protein [Candidatus Rokubacteria bacterium]|nr:ABC transporter substrate-binding protein [Candidatus Rokubacteria bacterium]
MRLRTAWFTIALALALLMSLHPAHAQQRGRVPHVGVLAAISSGTAFPYIEAGRQGLREHGYTEGQNIAIEYRWAEGGLDRLPDLAVELVRLKVDIIVAAGDPAIHAAKQATSTIPIVMVAVGEPVRSGFVSSLARPGGNMTGLSFLSVELAGKRFELLKEAIPKASRFAVLWNPDNPVGAPGFRATQTAARALGATLQSFEVRNAQEIEHAISALTLERADALIVLTDPLTWIHQRRITELAAKGRLPSIFELREYVDSGGLMSYGPSLVLMVRRAAAFVDKILKGARPSDLPVEQPTTIEFVINLRTARAVGVTIPRSLFLRADQVIGGPTRRGPGY